MVHGHGFFVTFLANLFPDTVYIYNIYVIYITIKIYHNVRPNRWIYTSIQANSEYWNGSRHTNVLKDIDKNILLYLGLIIYKKIEYTLDSFP
jgi:hypothetical protein